MLYALEDQLISIVAAADTLIEFEEFIRDTNSSVVSPESLGVVSAEIAGLMDVLTDYRLTGFARAPVLVEHVSPEGRRAFYEKFNISVMKRNALLDRQADMLYAEVEDPYSSTYTDSRPLEEIHGLVDNDPWDKRTDEAKAQDEAMKKIYKEAAAKGETSGDSFGPNPNRKGKLNADGSPVRITDIHAHTDTDGNIQIDNVLAVKGLHDQTDEEKAAQVAPQEQRDQVTMADAEAKRLAREAASAAAALAAAQAADADNEDLEIDIDGVIAIYHKIEVTGKKLSDIRDVLLTEDFDLEKIAIVQRNTALGCWFAVIRQIQAEQSTKVLSDLGFDVETYGTNDAGERLVPKGIQIVQEVIEGEHLPRPWNYRSKEIGKMKAAEKRDNDKSIKPKEFIFVGNYEGADQGTIIYVTPRSYFKEHGKMWEKPLNIDHILPQDFKEVMPGVYRSRSRDWNHISFDMASRGFTENLMLQIHLNQVW